MIKPDRVVVTGATGFIAKHVIANLLEGGFQVTGTVRRPEGEAEVRAAVARRVQADDRLTFASGLDLLSDAGWEPALAGARFVMHVASPYPTREPRDSASLIRPAVDGTLRVLAAARKAGVERVVLTSSVAAIAMGHRESREFDETDWSDVSSPTISAYSKSKTLAERAAWDDVARNGGPQLAVINPCQVFGPPLDGATEASAQIIRLILRSPVPFLPNYGFPVVDVRDVAAAHVAAMVKQAAGGERFIAASRFLWMTDIARLLNRSLPAKYRRRMPAWTLPNPLARLGASADAGLRAIKGDLGRIWAANSEKAQRVLGIRFRPAEEAAIAMAEALIADGTIR